MCSKQKHIDFRKWWIRMLEANAANKTTDGIIPENPFVIWKKKLTIITLDEHRDYALSVVHKMIRL